jgi:hypothetical protein
VSTEESLFLVSLESQLVLLFDTASDLLKEVILPLVLVLFVMFVSASECFLTPLVDFLLKIGLDPPPIFLIRFLKVLGLSTIGDSLKEIQVLALLSQNSAIGFEKI